MWAADSDRADTLEIRLEDRESRASVTLLYGVFEEKNIITRSVRFENGGNQLLNLNRLMSATVDYRDSEYDLVYFPGRHMMEREFERTPIRSGLHSIGSSRGPPPINTIPSPSSASGTPARITADAGDIPWFTAEISSLKRKKTSSASCGSTWASIPSTFLLR